MRILSWKQNSKREKMIHHETSRIGMNSVIKETKGIVLNIRVDRRMLQIDLEEYEIRDLIRYLKEALKG